MVGRRAAFCGPGSSWLAASDGLDDRQSGRLCERGKHPRRRSTSRQEVPGVRNLARGGRSLGGARRRRSRARGLGRCPPRVAARPQAGSVSGFHKRLVPRGVPRRLCLSGSALRRLGLGLPILRDQPQDGRRSALGALPDPVRIGSSRRCEAGRAVPRRVVVARWSASRYAASGGVVRQISAARPSGGRLCGVA